MKRLSLEFAGNPGLRAPTETTSEMSASLFLHLPHTRFSDASPSNLHHAFLAVKKEMKGVLQNMTGIPAEWPFVQKLPTPFGWVS